MRPVRELGAAVSASVPAETGSIRQSRGRLQRRAVDAANLDAGFIEEGDRVDPDPLITAPLYGRWHALPSGC